MRKLRDGGYSPARQMNVRPGTFERKARADAAAAATAAAAAAAAAARSLPRGAADSPSLLRLEPAASSLELVPNTVVAGGVRSADTTQPPPLPRLPPRPPRPGGQQAGEGAHKGPPSRPRHPLRPLTDPTGDRHAAAAAGPQRGAGPKMAARRQARTGPPAFVRCRRFCDAERAFFEGRTASFIGHSNEYDSLDSPKGASVSHLLLALRTLHL